MAKDKEELERLRRQLDKISVERDGLLAENRRLYRKFGKPRKSKPINQSGLVSTTSDSLVTGSRTLNNDSPLSEKSRLFRFLFRGREDVFARQWWSQKSQKIGYSPLCNREWNRTWCGKPGIKCGDCTNYDFAAVTDDVIRDHLDGKHTIGVYPLLLDETCYLLAIDFDKQSWMEDAAAFLETCHQMDIPAVIERSRSGNGAHIWIFFAEAVPATAARKLGCYLLTETMARRHQLGLDSYDRLFPNQDNLPKGGFGLGVSENRRLQNYPSLIPNSDCFKNSSTPAFNS